MPLALFRVDDRLVHGQVVIGWGRYLSAQMIVLVDDDVAESSWEQDLYRMAVPAGIEVIFATIAEAQSRLVEWQADPRVGILLTGSIEAMARLHHAAPQVVSSINLGGIHHRAERREKLRYLYLTEAEENLLRQLRSEGAHITAQDLPTTPPVDVGSLI
jgi:PTS system mannose-specific IIB component/fructoselysine and glucoselysine-specific PTS system IIB component